MSPIIKWLVSPLVTGGFYLWLMMGLVALLGLLFSFNSSYRMHFDISSLSSCFLFSRSVAKNELVVSGTLCLNLPPNIPASYSFGH